MSRARPRQRLRRAGLAWQNVLAIARAGRLSAPYGAPFEVVHEAPVFRLRRYPRDRSVADAPVAPLLLVPPLMIAAEVYDISPEISAIAFLQRAGVDVWLIDFGRPEREVGGMNRTLDDHVRAVADAIERVRAEAGRDIHLAGYSQGGMFCYQAAALRRGAGLASIVTFGSPVDLHRALRVDEGTTERLLSGLGAALAWPLAHTPGLPGILTATGFKLLSFRKEAMQLLDFVKNLHDREALEKREARRRFLGGGGFVAWPGPAFRKFIDDLVVDNRMAHGGFVIDGHTVSLADLACPILYFVGERDELGRQPPSAGSGARAPTSPRSTRSSSTPGTSGSSSAPARSPRPGRASSRGCAGATAAAHRRPARSTCAPPRPRRSGPPVTPRRPRRRPRGRPRRRPSANPATRAPTEASRGRARWSSRPPRSR